MAGRLLLVALMYYFSDLKAQALPPPKLTVNPAVITEKDSVTLNCQLPSSSSLSHCYFRFVRGEHPKVLSCLQTLTGSELLQMSHQSSPAEVTVTCFYLHGSQSPDSHTSSIIIASHPNLTVTPAVIRETDSVTMNCQPPSSVSVSLCYFNTLSGGTVRVFSCLQTLTGTELLKMSHQRSPAEVNIRCCYAVKSGERMSQSPYSETSSITIQSETPRMSLQHFMGEQVLFTCILPESANHDTSCNLYFGEDSRPVVTETIGKKMSSKNQRFCMFTVTIDDLLRRLRLALRKDASCDYSLGSKPNSLSPRSEACSLTDIVEKESSNTPTTPAFSMTTGLTVISSDASTLVTPVKQTTGRTVSTLSNTVSPTSSTSTSTSLTPVKPASENKPRSLIVYSDETDTSLTPVNPDKGKKEMWIWKLVAAVAGCGVTLGIILLVSAALSNKRRTVADSVRVKRPESQNENYDTYHLYSTITEEPADDLKGVMYSTVQKH